MATRNNETTKLAVRVEVGSGDDISYKNRNFNYIAPDTTDDNVLSFGNRLGALQSNPVNAVIRTDVAVLSAD